MRAIWIVPELYEPCSSASLLQAVCLLSWYDLIVCARHVEYGHLNLPDKLNRPPVVREHECFKVGKYAEHRVGHRFNRFESVLKDQAIDKFVSLRVIGDRVSCDSTAERPANDKDTSFIRIELRQVCMNETHHSLCIKLESCL